MPEVHRHIPHHCYKHGKQSRPSWTSCHLGWTLWPVFSLKYLFEDMEVSQGSPARTWATHPLCSHHTCHPQTLKFCGWGAVKEQPGMVSPCVSLWLKPAACSEWMGEAQGTLSSWPHEPHIKVFKRWRATNHKHCTIERQGERKLWEESLRGRRQQLPRGCVLCERVDTGHAAGC